MDKGKVLHVLGSMDRAGIQTPLMDVLRKTSKGKYRVSMDFLCLKGKKGAHSEEIESYGSKIIPMPLEKDPIGLARFSLNFIKLLKKGKYSIVHSHYYYFSGAILFLSYLAKVPIRISHIHNTDDGKKNTLTRRIYRKLMLLFIKLFATDDITISGLAAERFAGKKWKKDKRWKLIYYGIEPSPFLGSSEKDGLDVRAEFGIPNNAYVIGHVGRFEKQKNHEFLVKIAREVTAMNPNVMFLLAGNGRLYKKIRQKVKAEKIEKHFVFAGIRSDIPKLMKCMDIFLFPSLYEGVPLACLEAQLSSLRCLVSDTVSDDFVFVPNTAEFLSLKQPPKLWAEEALKLLKEPKPKKSDVISNFKKSNFRINLFIEKLMRMYCHEY